MGQRLPTCISKNSGRGETRAVDLIWKDPQLQAEGLAFIWEAEQSQPGAQNTGRVRAGAHLPDLSEAKMEEY